MINHSQLRCFHAVAVHGSFTRAAEVLHVTQPTVSDQVRTLEDRYQVRLFDRRGRRTELTDMGQALLEITRKRRELDLQAEQLLLTAHSLSHGRLRVATGSPYVLVHLLAAFRRLHPGVRFSISMENSREVLQQLFDARCDVAVLPDIGKDQNLHTVPLQKDRIIAYVNHEHPWSQRRQVSARELCQQLILLREPGSNTRAIFEAAMTGAGLRDYTSLEIGSREGVREAVAAGLGVGVVTAGEFGVDPRLHPLKLRLAGLEVQEYAACLKERSGERVIQSFLELARKQYP